ncbi:antitoxin VbhA family protein [Micrococcus luteus]|uniref:antitoxin VbhA family protein n=1 Tax=Micrococcus luteus TaxID=1270 RepID=UPI0021058021|nr:antitoxin VbhA family protein [Micrococcus luteus]UTX34979.1 antitoxin VbhA family protein [Micrococcus luteus]
MTTVPITATPTRTAPGERVAFADASLALAGLEVTDWRLRAIIEQAARDELTGDEAVAAIRRHVQS